MDGQLSRRTFGLAAVAGMIAVHSEAADTAAPKPPAKVYPNVPVPGTGQKVSGDDFEDANWAWVPNGSKSSYNLDKNIRSPGGISKNNLWFEAALRGQPDVIKRVTTPEDGIPGSSGSMMLATLQPGVPGRVTNDQQQDDLVHNLKSRLGGVMPVYQTPNATTRVWVPPVEKWERRNGSSFGFRAGLRATHTKKDKETGRVEKEEYWPGFFIQTKFTTDQFGGVHPTAHFTIRSDSRGRDLTGPKIEGPGWWTLGMTFTPDGQVHYFARQGINDLTIEDHLASHFPYGYRAYAMETIFYNVITMDNGRTWSTPWVVDDPAVYVATPVTKSRVATPTTNQRKR